MKLWGKQMEKIQYAQNSRILQLWQQTGVEKLKFERGKTCKKPQSCMFGCPCEIYFTTLGTFL